MKTTLSRQKISFHCAYAFLILSQTHRGLELEADMYLRAANSLSTLAGAVDATPHISALEDASRLMGGLAEGNYAPTPIVRAQAARALHVLHSVKSKLDNYETTEII